MVIKGGARGGPIALAVHLLRTDTNERVTIRELHGVTARDLRNALREMDSMGIAAESRRTLYHANIDTRIGEELTEAQKARAVERLAAKLGMTGQPRAVVEHVKHGREHMHVVFLRIDLDHMTAIPDSHNYRKHEELSRELEREFGHERVQGAHAERDGKKRPGRTPDHSEMQQAARSGITPQEAKARITELWQQADTGKAFAAALENDGWILARGDRRDFMILDRAGETHSLGKRIEGARAAQIRDRMADIDAARLPSVEEARTLYKARENDRRQVEQPEPAAASEITILKVTPPPNPQLGQPLELSQNLPPRLSAEDRQSEIRVISESITETPPPPKRDRIEQRPAPAMFRQLYTAAADITHRVLGKAKQLFDRPPGEEPKPERKPPPAPSVQSIEKEIIQVPKPPRLRPRPQAEPDLSEKIVPDGIEQKPKSRRPRMTVDEIRAQLERQHRDLDGPQR